MRNKNAVKENQARWRLLGFSLMTLGGAGLEGCYLRAAEEDVSGAAEKKARPLTQTTD
ncbi:hypothetical protein [Pseudomonas graminis]